MPGSNDLRPAPARGAERRHPRHSAAPVAVAPHSVGHPWLQPAVQEPLFSVRSRYRSLPPVPKQHRPPDSFPFCIPPVFGGHGSRLRQHPPGDHCRKGPDRGQGIASGGRCLAPRRWPSTQSSAKDRMDSPANSPCRLIEQQINYYQHDDRHTQDPTQHIFSHDRHSVRLMSSPIRVASAVVAGTRWQSGKRSSEGHYHSIKNM